MWKTRGILLPKSSVHHFPQTTKRVARPVSSVKIVFQQKQNIQTQRYTSTQDNEDIKSKICERAPLGIQPSTMNVARRSTHNPRAQHQTCVPLHVRHGGPRTFSDRDILVEDHGVCTVRKTTRTTCVQELNTNWDLHRGNKSFIRRVDSTQAAFQPARTHCSYNVRHLVLRYHLVFFFKKYLCRTDSWHCAEWKHEHHQST